MEDAVRHPFNELAINTPFSLFFQKLLILALFYFTANSNSFLL